MSGRYIPRDPYSFKCRNPLLRTTSQRVKLAVAMASADRLRMGSRSIIFCTPQGHWMDSAAQVAELLTRWGLVEQDPRNHHYLRLTVRGEGCLAASGIDVAETIKQFDKGYRAPVYQQRETR